LRCSRRRRGRGTGGGLSTTLARLHRLLGARRPGGTWSARRRAARRALTRAGSCSRTHAGGARPRIKPCAHGDQASGCVCSADDPACAAGRGDADFAYVHVRRPANQALSPSACAAAATTRDSCTGCARTTYSARFHHTSALLASARHGWWRNAQQRALQRQRAAPPSAAHAP
jgi:hypothetical protein